MSFLFGLEGRLNRAKLWGAYAIYVGIALLVILLAYGIVASSPRAGAAPVLSIVAVAVFVAFIVSSISVTVKRLHDRNRSGAWWWLMIFAPAVLGEIGSVAAVRSPEAMPVALLFTLASLIISIWAFIELFCLRGTIGANRYGPDPLDPVAAYGAVASYPGGFDFAHPAPPGPAPAYYPPAPASVPQVATPEPRAPAGDPADEILKLHGLLEKGAISREEYDSLKQAALRRSS